MWVQIILALLVLEVVALLASSRKPEGIPPGYWGWPIIGKLPPKDYPIAEVLKDLRKKHGDVISWKTGTRLFIYICDFKLMKSVFAKAETVDRPDLYSLRSFTEFRPSGIGNTNGQIWMKNRRFALQHLKDLGMGRSYLGDAIQQEAKFLVEDFKKHVGKPVSLPWSINVAVLNVIWQLVAGTRYDINDEKIILLQKLLNEALESADGPVTWLDMIPELASILPFRVRTWLGMNKVYFNSKAIRMFIQKEIVEPHVKNFDRDNARDFVDAYLLELENQKDDPNSVMSIDDLSYGMMDFFGDGSSTTSLTMRWAILYMAKYPEVQEKAYEQINSIVPRDELPSLEHKDSLPYIEAFINEVLRLSSIAPLGGPHTNSEDMQIGDYRIPKNSVIIGHLEGCHKDPAYWERPHELYPEHFLDENGKFVTKKEGFLPFQVGRRMCIGESLARMELYLFLSALIQNFKFSAPEGERLSTEKTSMERILAYPSNFEVLITERR